MKNGLMYDVVDPVMDEMLAKFVIDSHLNSIPKGAILDDNSINSSEEDTESSCMMDDPEVPCYKNISSC